MLFGKKEKEEKHGDKSSIIKETFISSYLLSL